MWGQGGQSGLTLACGGVAAVVARCLRGDGRARRGALLGPCRRQSVRASEMRAWQCYEAWRGWTAKSNPK